MIFGKGSAPVTFTSLPDASAIVRRALSDAALQGRTIEWGSEDHTLRELAATLIARAGHGTIQMTTPAMLRVIAVAARPFSPFLARMAGAGAWMDTGAMHFDIAPNARRIRRDPPSRAQGDPPKLHMTSAPRALSRDSPQHWSGRTRPIGEVCGSRRHLPVTAMSGSLSSQSFKCQSDRKVANRSRKCSVPMPQYCQSSRARRARSRQRSSRSPWSGRAVP